MSLIFGIVMCILLIPTLLIMFFILYPKNWKSAKMILGLTMKKEFKEGETEKTIDMIYSKRRGQAQKVLYISLALSIVLLLLHGFILQTTLWMVLFYASLIGIFIPFFLGNKEMKTLKRTLGLSQEQKVIYTDINTAGSIHTIKFSSLLIPNIIGLFIVIAALLVDLKVINVKSTFAGNFLGTGLAAIFWAVGLLISGVAYMMDNLKNEVISTDSAINANYNRAKKKNLSDFSVKFLWLNTILLATTFVFLVLWYSELLFFIFTIIYLLIIMIGIFMYVLRDKKIEQRYEKEMTVTQDEDDNWIGGIIYYNPNNKRLNVKKRVGVGSTVNAAHPVGKLVYAFIVLVFMFTLGSLVYVGMTEATPIKLKLEDNKLICHQLSDDYVIDINDITAIEWGEDVNNLKLAKISGFGISNLYKGNFSVNGNSCKVFLNPEEGNYIKVMTAEMTYYVSAATSEETKIVYEQLQS